MQIRDFLAVLRARWFTVACCALVVLAAASAATLSITPVYTATTRVFFSAVAPAEEDEAGGVYVITQADLATYVDVVGSPVVREPLVEELGLDGGFGLSAKVPASSPMLDITVTADDPQVAAEIANAVGPQLAEVAGEFSPLLASAGQDVTATTITPATAPTSPSSPDVLRNLALGLLAGLVLGVGIAFVRHGLDTRVRGEADVRAVSDRPILATVGLDRAVRQQPVVMESDPHGAHAEAIRRLRTNLLFVDVTTRRHSFVVTSAVPGEGKTTTTVNLAIAMADAGSRVLLVDADLRNPSVATTMGLEGAAGLTTVLLGRASADEVIQPWRDTSLHVLPAGQIPPNPSELLGSDAMAELFTELAGRYDFVLVDSPPVVPVIDAVIINRLTGGMLMVVAVDQVGKRELAAALRSLETAGVNVSGFALNKVQGLEGKNYGYPSYGVKERWRPGHTRRGRTASVQAAAESAAPGAAAPAPKVTVTQGAAGP